MEARRRRKPRQKSTFAVKFFWNWRGEKNNTLECRLQNLEAITKAHQEVLDDIAKYVEADIAAPWMPSAKNLVWKIKSIPRIE
jgi:hypothetical protein